MDLLSRFRRALVGSNTAASNAARKDDRNCVVSDGYLTIKRPRSLICGKVNWSPNANLCVACSSGDAKNGKVVLVDYSNDHIMNELGPLFRPLEAVVSNSGRVLTLDGLVGNELQSHVVAFDVNGRECFRRKYAAIGETIGISACGRFGAAQTNNAPGKDGSILELFNIAHGRVSFSVPRAIFFPVRLEFEVVGEELKFLWIEDKKLGRFAMRPTGEFDDPLGFANSKLIRGDFSTKLTSAQALLRGQSPDQEAERVLMAAQTALEEIPANASDWGVLANRLIGEACELFNRPDQALAAYETALQLNPKIGISKRAKKLRQQLKP